MAEGGVSVWGPVLLSAASAGVSYASSEKEDKQRMAALRRAGESEQEQTKKAGLTALEGAQKYDPQARLAAQGEAEKTAASSLGTALTQAESTLPNTDVQGRVSDEFLADKGKATTERMARSLRLAQAMARMRAPNDLRFSEGLDNADVASRIGDSQSNARNALEAGRLDASAVQPDGAAGLGSLLLRGGAAYAGSRGKPKTKLYEDIYDG